MKVANQVFEGFELHHEIAMDARGEVVEGTYPAFGKDVIVVDAHLEDKTVQDVDLPAAFAVEGLVGDKSYGLLLQGPVNAVAEAGDDGSMAGLAEK